MQNEKLFDYIAETTRAAAELGIVDRAKTGKLVSAKTAATYRKNARGRLDLSAPGGGPLMDGVSAASWHSIKAALVHEAAAQYMEARRGCDRAQKAKRWTQAQAFSERARAAVDAITAINQAKRPAPSKPRSTKRRTLPKTDTWQSQVWEASTPAQKPSVAVMWATGCRPAELERGVLVERVKTDGKRAFRITINGAKVREHSGQPTRAVFIDPDSDAGKALSASIEKGRRVIVQRKAKRLNKDFADIRQKTGFKISPYSLRHQVCADLKRDLGADDAETVAAAMGHAVTKSQGRYGSVRQGRAGKSGFLAVQAARPVRETRPGRISPAQPNSEPGF